MSNLKVQPAIPKPSSYEDVAAEYYDSERHPTCANFREASRLLLRAWLVGKRNTRLCEIGAGKSVVAEIFSDLGYTLEHVTLVDESPSMLSYSKPWIRDGAKLELGSSSHLPFAASEIDLIVSCLGDPYNGAPFWQEVQRVLRNGGECMLTTPSYDWATNFRRKTHSDLGSALFELADGTQLLLPSVILSPTDQTALVESCGLQVRKIQHVSVESLSGQSISPKLLVGSQLKVVTGYVVAKP
jgi:SAM-dependent methyltransferase